MGIADLLLLVIVDYASSNALICDGKPGKRRRNDRSGCVEEVMLRHIRLRDSDGSVHFIPNDVITAVTNKSRNYAIAGMGISIPLQQEPEQAIGVLSAVRRCLRQNLELGSFFLDVVDVAGIENAGRSCRDRALQTQGLPQKQALVTARNFMSRSAGLGQNARIPAPLQRGRLAPAVSGYSCTFINPTR